MTHTNTSICILCTLTTYTPLSLCSAPDLNLLPALPLNATCYIPLRPWVASTVLLRPSWWRVCAPSTPAWLPPTLSWPSRSTAPLLALQVACPSCPPCLATVSDMQLGYLAGGSKCLGGAEVPSQLWCDELFARCTVSSAYLGLHMPQARQLHLDTLATCVDV